MPREVQASAAKTHLPRLLDEVERGETIIITRHGRPIARIVPETSQRQREIDQAIADIEELRKRTGKFRSRKFWPCEMKAASIDGPRDRRVGCCGMGLRRGA